MFGSLCQHSNQQLWTERERERERERRVFMSCHTTSPLQTDSLRPLWLLLLPNVFIMVNVLLYSGGLSCELHLRNKASLPFQPLPLVNSLLGRSVYLPRSNQPIVCLQVFPMLPAPCWKTRLVLQHRYITTTGLTMPYLPLPHINVSASELPTEVQTAMFVVMNANRQ